MYYFVTTDEINQYGYSPTYEATGGGWILAMWWYTRSPYLGNRTQFIYLNGAGNTYNGNASGNTYAPTPCFSF